VLEPSPGEREKDMEKVVKIEKEKYFLVFTLTPGG
jgi:hypothetical protein